MSTANLTRAEAAGRTARLSVHDYPVELDLTGAPDADSTTFPTTTTVRFSATCAETFLDFLGAGVERVVLNGTEVDPAFDGARVRLTGLGAENEVTVVARGVYPRSGEGLHRFVDPADGETYLYTQAEPADSRRVFPVFEQPDLKAPFTFVVTAPAAWRVLSNQVATDVRDHGSAATTTFAPTPPVSSYLTAVVAGPYHRVDGAWAGRAPDGTAVEIDLGVLCRASLAEHLDAENILTVTRQGLGLFHDRFAYPYPWGKYDQVFVPEYHLGAMENPGLVTFGETYVFRSAATRDQHQRRAGTILHEMAHMWFGDLVTPRWWDELWLKESLADYMGTYACAEAAEFTDAWVSFANRRKAWAYTQDQLPTTHPVVADIADLEAAQQNFDGITYAKGASVLKQLVAYAGTGAFFAGAREYLRAHAFGSTTLPDLLGPLEAASGRDLAGWTRAWLQTAGTPVLTPVLRAGDDGTIASLTVEQAGTDPTTGAEVLRPHRLVVGLYTLGQDADGGPALTRTARLETDVTGVRTELPAAVGLPRPDLVLVNDEDLTYAKVRLDDVSLGTAADHLGDMPDTLARSLVWSALWNATRDGLLPAARYVDLVLRHGTRESDSAVLAGLTADAAAAVEDYVPAGERPRLRARLAEGCWDCLHAAPAGSDVQLVWARALARAGAVVPDLRWSLWRALAALGAATLEDLDAELKETAWQTLLVPGALSNDHVEATVAGFDQPWHRQLRTPFVARYFAALEDVWEHHSTEITTRLVRGLFPCRTDVPAGEPGVLAATDEWLAAHAGGAGGLRRLVLEARDNLARAHRAGGGADGGAGGGAA